MTTIVGRLSVEALGQVESWASEFGAPVVSALVAEVREHRQRCSAVGVPSNADPAAHLLPARRRLEQRWENGEPVDAELAQLDRRIRDARLADPQAGYLSTMTENQPEQTEVPVEQPAKEHTTTEVDATPETADVAPQPEEGDSSTAD